MGQLALTFATAAAFVLSASSLWACSAGPTGAWAKPVTYAADGSFVNAGRGKWGHGQGGPVTDIGNGRIAQKVSYGAYGCVSFEYLFFMNCASGSGILLLGIAPGPGEAQIAGALFTDIARIQPPLGPIAITSSRTVAELRATAQENDIRFDEDLNDFFRKNKDLKKIRYHRACASFYPDSKGAKG